MGCLWSERGRRGKGRGTHRAGRLAERPREAQKTRIAHVWDWGGLDWGWDTASNHKVICASAFTVPTQPGRLPRHVFALLTLQLPSASYSTNVHQHCTVSLCRRCFILPGLSTMFQKQSLCCLTRPGSARILLRFTESLLKLPWLPLVVCGRTALDPLMKHFCSLFISHTYRDHLLPEPLPL